MLGCFPDEFLSRRNIFQLLFIVCPFCWFLKTKIFLCKSKYRWNSQWSYDLWVWFGGQVAPGLKCGKATTFYTFVPRTSAVLVRSLTLCCKEDIRSLRELNWPTVVRMRQSSHSQAMSHAWTGGLLKVSLMN